LGKNPTGHQSREVVVGIRLTRTDTGEQHEVRTVADADDYEVVQPGPWTRERTTVPPDRNPGFVPPTPPRHTLQERAER
jgi:hypothetical protein